MLKELENYLLILNDLRNQVKNLLEKFPDEALDWRPIEGEGDLATNSVAIMVVHLVGSESFWIKEVIGNQPIHRDRDAEFITKGVAVAELKRRLEVGGQNVETTLSSLTSAQLEESRKWRDRIVPVRWCIVHVIEHFAMHLGHMQLTYQLWLAKSRG